MTSSQDDYLVVNIIESFLGSAKTSTGGESRSQWEFNCPSSKCRKDQHKYNLAYQSQQHVFKCWKCSYSGFVHRLVKEFGSTQDYTRLKLILPEYKQNPFNIFRKAQVNYDLITCPLPVGYMPLSQLRKSHLYEKAWDYVTNTRKVSLAQIDKLKIGYTEQTGPRKHRIILPSLNSQGKINYWEARDYLDDPKVPYWKPQTPHVSDIIFNEYNINWNLPVYIVEGVFDALRIPNSIPLLGKKPSDLLFFKLLLHKPKVIVCLDADAIKDGMEFYKKLSSLGLDVYFIDLKGYKDISKIFEEGGQEAVNEVLRTSRKIDEVYEISRLLNE